MQLKLRDVLPLMFDDFSVVVENDISYLFGALIVYRPNATDYPKENLQNYLDNVVVCIREDCEIVIKSFI